MSIFVSLVLSEIWFHPLHYFKSVLNNNCAYCVKVSHNGLVSFEEYYHPSDIRSFPLTSLPVPLIAPLWTTFLPTLSGPVYHRTAQDSDTLGKVAQMIIDENSELEGYTPSIAVIISWYEARFPEDESRRTHQYDNEVRLHKIYSLLFSSSHFDFIMRTGII